MGEKPLISENVRPGSLEGKLRGSFAGDTRNPEQTHGPRAGCGSHSFGTPAPSPIPKTFPTQAAEQTGQDFSPQENPPPSERTAPAAARARTAAKARPVSPTFPRNRARAAVTWRGAPPPRPPRTGTRPERLGLRTKRNFHAPPPPPASQGLSPRSARPLQGRRLCSRAPRDSRGNKSVHQVSCFCFASPSPPRQKRSPPTPTRVPPSRRVPRPPPSPAPAKAAG